jgi:hypothetical protein
MSARIPITGPRITGKEIRCVTRASAFDLATAVAGLPGERLVFVAERNEHNAPLIHPSTSAVAPQ